MPAPVTSSAPGKVILLGEHAVVFGEPAIAVAINKRTRVTVRDGEGDTSRVNGFPLSMHYHVHLALAVERLAAGEKVDLTTESQVASAAGTGSSAALTAATVHALLRRAGKSADEETVAREAYEVEWLAQGGRGSPTDTTAATHGHGILVSEEEYDGLLWTVNRGPRAWRLHHLDLPSLTLVVGNTHERGKTSDQVAKVGRFVARGGFGREIVRDLGDAARQGLLALAAGDAPALGEAMDRAQQGLETLGVSTRKLERACVAARRAGALGAKLTGSGGGGSMIALVQGDPLPVARAVNRAGCSVFVSDLGVDGVRAEDAV